VYVMDHCAGVDFVLHHGELGEAYNIGTDSERPNIEVVRRVLELLGKPESLIKSIPDPRGGAHDFRYSIDASKLKALGWKPQFEFDAALEQTVCWYADNQGWWRDIISRPDYQAFVAQFYGRSLGDDL
jgi:dTDP-glucose 4,6-dehydratase